MLAELLDGFQFQGQVFSLCAKRKKWSMPHWLRREPAADGHHLGDREDMPQPLGADKQMTDKAAEPQVAAQLVFQMITPFIVTCREGSESL